MKTKPTIYCFVGTRPEYIKTYPVIKALKARDDIQSYLVETGQHQDLLADMFECFDIKPDFSLPRRDSSLPAHEVSEAMSPPRHCERSEAIPAPRHCEARSAEAIHQLAKLASDLLSSATEFLIEQKPNLVIVQGDTISATQVALAAWYLGIPVAHIEAGLRTYDVTQPYPEELGRRTIDHLAALNFAPTPLAMDNLSTERTQGRAFLTGNTVVDALSVIASEASLRGRDCRSNPIGCTEEIASPFGLAMTSDDNNKPYILITAHRRENQAKVIPELVQAIKQSAQDNPHYNFIIIKHANPLANQPFDLLMRHCEERSDEAIPMEIATAASLPRDDKAAVIARRAKQPTTNEDNNIILLPPQTYPNFLELLAGASFVVSDSGGIQEEAPYFEVPVLVLRELTEREEGLNLGFTKLAGSEARTISANINELIQDPSALANMRRAIRSNPSVYGDGQAAARIVKHCLDFICRAVPQRAPLSPLRAQ